MKIAYFLDITPVFGGATTYILKQAVLMSEVYDIVVVIPRDAEGVSEDEYIKRCEDCKLRYVGLKYVIATNFSELDFSLNMKCVAEIEQFVREEKPDILHSSQLNLTVEYISRRMKIPHLMNIFQLPEDEFSLCSADIYPRYHLCDSLLYSNRWASNLIIESRCIRPIAPLDRQKRKEERFLKTVKILLLGNVCERKRQLSAIKAVENIKEDFYNIELHIVGDNSSSYAVECMKYVNEHEMNNMVTFHGHIVDVSPFLEKCDWLLCTSIDESFPSSVVEALTYGLIIISTPVAGIPEVFFDKKNAFISKDYTEESIAESILNCYQFCQNGAIVEIQDNAEITWKLCFEKEQIKKQIRVYYEYISKEQKIGERVIYDVLKKDVAKIEKEISSIDVQGENWIFRRGLYYWTIRKLLGKGYIYIWGAGKWGKLALELLSILCPELKVIAFIDMYKIGELNGIPIIHRDEAIYDQRYFYSVSFAINTVDTLDFLKNKGLAMNRQIWKIP